MAESSLFNFYRAAENERNESSFWLFRLLNMVLTLMAVTALTDIAIVLFWPDGLGMLKRTYLEEIQYLNINISAETSQRIASWANTAYDWVFIKSGFQSLLYSGGNSDVLRSLVKGFWPVLQGISIGFHIFIIRLCVILLMIPLLALVMAVASSDGFLEWYRRRTGGARESAFIYHRSKHMLTWSLVGIWFAYLVPPFAVNPAYIFIPSALFLGLTTRLSIQFFKKYV